MGYSLQVGDYYRRRATKATVDQDETWNGRFEILSFRGVQMRNGEIILPPRFVTEELAGYKWYQTVMYEFLGSGAHFEVQDATGYNMNRALSRLFKRLPEQDDLELYEIESIRGLLHAGILNRRLMVKMSRGDSRSLDYGIWTSNPLVEAALRHVRAVVRNGCDWLDMFLAPLRVVKDIYGVAICEPLSHGLSEVQARIAYANQPHIKKALRQQWEKFLKRSHRVVLGEPADTSDPEAMFKHEVGKFRKAGRVYISYGMSCVQGGWVFEIFKARLCRRWDFSSVFGFEVIIDIFYGNDLSIKAPFITNGIYAALFSDDQKMTVYNSMWSDRYEIDISSCDSNNKRLTYGVLFSLVCDVVGIDMCEALIERLQSPITCRNPSDPEEFIRMQPQYILEGSGHETTTAVNDVASLLIVLEIVSVIVESGGISDGMRGRLERTIETGANFAGHKVTVVRRSCMQQQTFLKYSSFLSTEGEIVPMINLGTLFRSFGKIDGDLDHIKLGVTDAEFRNMSFERRAEVYVGNVVLGWKNEPSCSVFVALRARFRTGRKPIIRKDITDVDRSHHIISDEEVCKRYPHLTPVDLEELCHRIMDMRLGSVIVCKAIEEFFYVDYGLDRGQAFLNGYLV